MIKFTPPHTCCSTPWTAGHPHEASGGRTASQSVMSQINMRARSMCPISPLCRIHYTVNITLVQCVAPAVWFAGADAEPKERERERGRKKPSAGHNFHWQLVNKLKQRDAGTIFLPLFLLSPSLSCCLLSPPLLLQTTGAFPKNLLGSDGLFRCWNWWKGYITQE